MANGVTFTKDGPSLPIALLQALEDGQLVVFCGAGVSMRCGLPDFRGLVLRICEELGRPMRADEQDLFDNSAFDAALGLIENRVGPGPVRSAVRKILTLPQGADLKTHEALLQLAASSDRHVHLVTTNFDEAFERVAEGASLTVGSDYAPFLPLPGRKWSGIVHLHGGLEDPRNTDGNSLVLTGADFGRAYITEGWASRFLTELFRRSKAILFVGYSVADPVVRYIVDAFAADRAGENSAVAQAFILAAGEPGHFANLEQTWMSRGIEPILYGPVDDHRLLHETLQNCAKHYQMGLFDRQTIIHSYASHLPAVGLGPWETSQVVWALREPTGHTARRFADLDPLPPIEWLQILSEEHFFDGVPKEHLSFAVSFAQAHDLIPTLDHVTEGLCRWLCKHLDDPRLAEWAIDRGCHLHSAMANQVRAVLQAPTIVLPTGARLLWTFLATIPSAVHSPAMGHEVIGRLEWVRDGEWDPMLRDYVLTCFAPTIRFKKPFKWSDEDIDRNLVGAYAEIELTPAAGRDAREIADALLGRTDSDRLLAELFGTFTNLVRTGLSYLEYLGLATSDFDRTYADRPSIDAHPQNSDFYDWTIYVDLLTAAWQRLSTTDSVLARCEVERWLRLPYPFFRRMVLWSTAKSGGLSVGELVGWLADQGPETLWGLDTYRELLQCLVRIAPSLDADKAKELTDTILPGPPRSLYRDSVSDEEFSRIRDREIYLRLLKLEEGGLSLPAIAKTELNEILARYPEWPRSTSERDEFLVWQGGGDFFHFGQEAERLDDYLDEAAWPNERVQEDIAAKPEEPSTIARLRSLLIQKPERAIVIFERLGAAHFFDQGVWKLAIEHLNNDGSRGDCLRLLAMFASNLGSGFIDANLYSLADIIISYCRAKKTDYDEFLWRLWDIVAERAVKTSIDEDTDDPVTRALNSPIGRLTEALLSKLSQLSPATYEQIPPDIQARFEGLIGGNDLGHPFSRLLVARYVAWLYGQRPDLARSHFLSRFDWAKSSEARLLWSGFLMSPNLTPDLWSALRQLVLDAVPHAHELGRYEDYFYQFIASVLLHPGFEFEPYQARVALTAASPAGRAAVASHWMQHVNSATDHGATLFRERLRYLIESVWPIELALREAGSSAPLARLVIHCGDEFENAVATIAPRLAKLSEPGTLLYSLNESEHPDRYPRATLALLDAVIGDDVEVWSGQYVRNILTRIAGALPELAGDVGFVRLDTMMKAHE